MESFQTLKWFYFCHILKNYLYFLPIQNDFFPDSSYFPQVPTLFLTDSTQILTTFPEELQSDVCMHLYKGLLELNPFNQAPRGCIKMLSLQVRTVYIGPGEMLLAQNDVINAIYYIASGSMEVLQGESVAAILGTWTFLATSFLRSL